jgi:hypothetical protein
LHIKTSEWDKHAHTEDENYRNVILHVVWEHDIPDYSFLPLISLKERVSKLLLEQYESWMQQQRFYSLRKSNPKYSSAGMVKLEGKVGGRKTGKKIEIHIAITGAI